MTTIDLQPFQSWLERREHASEHLSPVPASCLAATLNLATDSLPAGELPPLWHWLHFFDRTPSAELGPDGSPKLRKLLPPLPLPQVMWAGAEVEQLRPLRLERPASRTSRLLDMNAREGSRGPMVFMTSEHRIEQDGQTAIIERNRAVFLGPAAPRAASAPPEDPSGEREREWQVDEPVLFRFSALTFNPHRIHYDLRYCIEVAGYPALVVHGPLQAVLLAESFRQWHPGARLRKIAFRAQAPYYCNGKVVVRGEARGAGQYALWTRPPEGGACMSCLIDFDPA